MKAHRILIVFLLFSVMPAAMMAQRVQDRLYGRLITRDGDVYEGLIRWDKNEVGWVDLLDGSKRIEDEDRDHRRKRIRVFGIDLGSFDDGVRTRKSGIRFGHLRSIEKTGRDRALLTLRSGEEIEFRGGSTDLGNEIRGIVVEDKREGEISFDWRDFDRIEFLPTPRRIESIFGERLYGTLTTREGDVFTGYVCWDVDEALDADVLDGRDEDGARRKIPFAEIDALIRERRNRTRVVLRDGEEIVLHGTNDVNDDNRGILILDPALGQIRVPWEAFDELRLEAPERPVTYRDFDGSGPLRGVVYTRDGDKYAGRIRWDDDEAASWEMLNGERDDLDFAIEFGFIREIERVSSRAALVTLRDGRSFELRGSNDVNDDNDGIVVALRNGDVVVIEWEDFDRAVFDKP